MNDAVPSVAEADSLDFAAELSRLRGMIAAGVEAADPELRPALAWQFGPGAKGFRPLTVFACYRACHGGPIPERVIRRAFMVELFHNVSLIIDDILDRSPTRRGRATLHARFGELTALMASGYIVADGYADLRDDPEAAGLFSELLKRLAAAECLQWRL